MLGLRYKGLRYGFIDLITLVGIEDVLARIITDLAGIEDVLACIVTDQVGIEDVLAFIVTDLVGIHYYGKSFY